jgi:peptide/nickel transport system substrate-binding protein
MKLRVWLLTMMLVGNVAVAQELRVGMKGVVDGADPHQSFSPNRNVQYHVYEPLVFQDAFLKPYPGLAESWKPMGPLTWSFTLRPGVTFQDGTPLTPEDVAFSLLRAKAATGIRTYQSSVRNVVSVERVDDRTFLIHESAPTPLQPAVLASVAIVSAKAAADATTSDWNGGRAAIGTGPYRWVKWNPGQDVVLARNPSYWGPKEPWEKVVFRFISNDSARVAGLLAGDIDVADTLPAELYERVKASDKLTLLTTDSVFTNYFYIDSISPRLTAGNATGPDGQPLPTNPLRDLRVRTAIDHALNRPALADRAMQGGATAADQIAAVGLQGHVDGLSPTRFDPALGRRLLAEAGYPNGFALTLSCTSDRFAGDGRTCQAVAQMLGAIGIKVSVDAQPTVMYFRNWATILPSGSSSFAATISMFGSTTGVASEGMNTILHTWDTERGLGASNRHFTSDAAFDAMLGKVDSTFEDGARETLTQDAVRYAMAQRLALPLFYVKASWGLRRDLTLVPRADQYTLATTVRRITP